jgi:hypothetical protein
MTKRIAMNRRKQFGLAIEAMEARRMLTASFAESYVFESYTQPTDLVVTNLNNDARPDVVVADSGGVALVVRLGSPVAGQLSATTIVPTGSVRPERVLAGDLNGNGTTDLVAVSSYDVNALTAQFVTFTGTVRGDGFVDYAAGPVVNVGSSVSEARLADLTGDGLLDLITVGVLEGVAEENLVRVFPGNGSGGFGAAIYTQGFVGDVPQGLAIADFDGNNQLDYAVGTTNPITGYTDPQRINIVLNPLGGAQVVGYRAVDTQPVSLAAGDYNEDGAADLILNQAGNARGVVYLPNLGAGNFGTAANAATTIYTPAAFTGPVRVADVDGDGNLDVVSVGPNIVQFAQGRGDGTFASASNVASTGDGRALDLGDMNGDGKPDAVVTSFEGDTLGIHLNTSTPGIGGGGGTTPPPAGTVDLDAAIGKVTLPSVFVPGDKGTAQVVVTNNGSEAVRGRASVVLYASSDAVLDDADVALDTGTTLANRPLNAAPGRGATLTGKFVAPATLASGTYFLLARVTPSGVDGATEVVAASATAYEAATAFGQVGTRRNVRYTFTDADGSLVTYSLSGAGTGTVSTAGGDLTITLSDTAASSRFTATARGGSGDGLNETSVASLVATLPLSGVNANALQVTKAVTLADVKTVVLEDVYGDGADVAVTLSGATPVSITFDDVRDANINSTAPIKSLKVDQWADTGFAADSVSAPFLTALTVSENLGASLTLSGAGAPRAAALGSARIGGSVLASIWDVEGDVGAVTIGESVAAGWVGNLAGAIKSLAVKGNFAGSLAAANIGAVTVTGDATNARMRAGWSFGADNVPDTADDAGVAGVITKLSVRGAVSASQFWAGVNANGNPIEGGAIRSIAMNSVDLDTRFVAASVPRALRFGGTSVDTSADPRFVTSVV